VILKAKTTMYAPTPTPTPHRRRRVRFLRAKFVTHITLPPALRHLMLLRSVIIFNNLLADVFYISRLFTEFIHRVLTPRGLKQVLFSFLLCRNTKQ